MEYLALFGSLGTPELVVILVVVLIIFGPKSLPKLARALGSSLREFKDATSKVTDSIMNDEDEDETPRPRQTPREVEGQQVRSTENAKTDSEKEKVSSSGTT